MLNLLVFAAVERVIVDQFDNSASLIGVFGGITIPVGPEFRLAPGVGIPFRWAAFSLFEATPDESGAYQQRVQLLTPSGIVVFESFMDFQATNRIHRNRVAVEGFPLVEMGRHRLELSLRRSESEKWEPISTYPMYVQLADPSAPKWAPTTAAK
jgi:hypothetical protein